MECRITLLNAGTGNWKEQRNNPELHPFEFSYKDTTNYRSDVNNSICIHSFDVWGWTFGVKSFSLEVWSGKFEVGRWRASSVTCFQPPWIGQANGQMCASETWYSGPSLIFSRLIGLNRFFSKFDLPKTDSTAWTVLLYRRGNTDRHRSQR